MARIAIFIGWALLILGVANVILGFAIASIPDPAARAEAVARYLGSGSTGGNIDQALITAFCGLVLLLLGRISTDLRQLGIAQEEYYDDVDDEE